MSGRKCTASTQSGKPCRAWALRESDPPRCSAHAGRNQGAGAPKGNQNRLAHGFYSRFYTLEELADLLETADIPELAAEIATARIAVRRVLQFLHDQNGRHLDPQHFHASIALLFTGSSTVARLLRQQRAISGEAADTLTEALAAALEQVGDQLDLDL
jgi:uncharacterized protein YjcR